MWKEFKEFIMRGNVMDLAVAVVIGGAFTAIVESLVTHIITPIIAAVTGNATIGEIVLSIGPAELGVGAFIQAIIDFLLIALVIFLMIKVINTIGERFKRDEPEEIEIEAPTAEQYLEEIRDLLAAQNNNPIHSSEESTFDETKESE